MYFMRQMNHINYEVELKSTKPPVIKIFEENKPDSREIDLSSFLQARNLGLNSYTLYLAAGGINYVTPHGQTSHFDLSEILDHYQRTPGTRAGL